MGTYFAVACDELKEKLDPGSVNNGPIKLGGMCMRGNPFGALTLYTMAGGRWYRKACRIVNDSADDPGYFDYTDVTAEAIIEYNDSYEESLEHTP